MSCIIFVLETSYFRLRTSGFTLLTHWFGPIESGVALRNEVGVEVGDRAVGVGVDRVVGRVGVQLHRLLERLVALGLRARVRLRERLERLLHQPDAHPLALRLADDGPVMRAV